MSCDTFRRDSSGMDTLATGQEWSPLRTRAFLVLTFRDRFLDLDRKEWMQSIGKIRKQFSWVGPVALIDQNVSVDWLYKTIVACAGYTPMCCTDHYIPLVEFFVKFPLSFDLTEEEKTSLATYRFRFCRDIAAASQEVEKIKRERLQGFSYSSRYVEKLGASLDCLIRFVDDLFDCTTWEALAELCNCDLEDLWLGEEALWHSRVERWNAIKMYFAQEYQAMKKQIQKAFPDEAGAAVYKMCPYCKEVYVKPLGCDFGTHCGESVGGADTVPFTYSYNPETGEFKVLDKAEAVRATSQSQQTAESRHVPAFSLQNVVSKLRVAYRKAAGKFSLEPCLEAVHSPKIPNSAALVKKRGCGAPLKWETMPCLTKDELVANGLVPDYVPLEPCNMAATAPARTGGSSWWAGLSRLLG